MRSAAARSNLLVPEVREVMDIRQASDYLGISPDTLYKYASEGFVPAFKLGNRWRFKRSRLDEWMDRQSDIQAATPRSTRTRRSPSGRRCKGRDQGSVRSICWRLLYACPSSSNAPKNTVRQVGDDEHLDDEIVDDLALNNGGLKSELWSVRTLSFKNTDP